MGITLLCILFYSDLNFEGLTISYIFEWYGNHPFWAMFAITEIVSDIIKLCIKEKKWQLKMI